MTSKWGLVMLPSAHFFSGIALCALFSTFNVLPRDFSHIGLVVAFSIIPDVDIIWSSLHRNKLTHTPIFWGFIAALIVAINRGTWIIIPPLLFHLFLDTIDYGIMVLYPFSRKKHGLRLLEKDSTRESKALTSYLAGYLSDSRFLCAELTIMSTSMLLLAWAIACS